MIKVENGKVSIEGTNLDLALDLVSIIGSIAEDDPTLITLAQMLCADDLTTALNKADMEIVKCLVKIIEPIIKIARK